MAEETLLQQPPIKTIWTPRLQLKTVTMDDLEDIMSFITLKEVMQWTSVGQVSSKTQGRQWLSARALGPEVFNFAIRERVPRTDSEVKPRAIGLFGCFQSPSCGYMLHPNCAGKGYATEGMGAWIPAYWERFPETDILDGSVDAENVGSMRVLEKCGFMQCEYLEKEFLGPMGIRDSIVWRMARPGKTLKELGFSPAGETVREDEPPDPPVQ